MAGLDLEKNQVLIIQNKEYIVSEIIKRDIMKNHDERVNYYSYELKSDDKDTTHAALDYISDDNLLFHLTKKVQSKISDDSVVIDGVKYSLVRATDEIYIDPLDGDLRDAKCYQISGEKTGITPSELHVKGDGDEILYLALHLKKDEVLIK